MNSGQRNLVEIILEIVAPALVMLTVGSFTFFLVTVFHDGELMGRIIAILGFYTFATVLITRLTIQDDAPLVPFYSIVLGLLVLIGLQRFAAITGPLAPLSLLVHVAFMAFTWFFAHKLTKESTFVDLSQDVTAKGLLDNIGGSLKKLSLPFQREVEAREVLPDKQPRDEEEDAKSVNPLHWFRRKKANSPGVWIVYFAFICVPVFAFAQGALPVTEVGRRQWSVILFTVYLISSLSLLMVTSLIGVMRYVHQRSLELPNQVVRFWLLIGIMAILFIAAVSWLVPRPAPEWSIANNLPSFLKPPDWVKPNSWSVGNDGRESNGGRRSSQTSPDGDQQNNSGQNSSGQNSSGQNSSGQSNSGQSNSGQNSSGQNSSGQNSSGQNSSGRATRTEQLRTEQLRAKTTQDRTAQDRTTQTEQLGSEQLGSEQLRAEQLRAEQLRAEQLRAEQLRAEQLRAEQLRAEQLRAEQLRAEHQEQLRAEQLRANNQVRTTRVRTTQVRTAQVRTAQVRTTQGRTTQGRTTQVRTTRVRTTQVRTTRVRTTQVRTTQVRTTQGRTTQGRTARVKTARVKTAPGRTAPGRTTPGRTTPGRTTQGRTTQGRTTQGGTVPRAAPPRVLVAVLRRLGEAGQRRKVNRRAAWARERVHGVPHFRHSCLTELVASSSSWRWWLWPSLGFLRPSGTALKSSRRCSDFLRTCADGSVHARNPNRQNLRPSRKLSYLPSRFMLTPIRSNSAWLKRHR
ncbi:MAG: hypothetical protein R3B96_04410 [Pirellulaceae bacterium]